MLVAGFALNSRVMLRRMENVRCAMTGEKPNPNNYSVKRERISRSLVVGAVIFIGGRVLEFPNLWLTFGIAASVGFGIFWIWTWNDMETDK